MWQSGLNFFATVKKDIIFRLNGPLNTCKISENERVGAIRIFFGIANETVSTLWQHL